MNKCLFQFWEESNIDGNIYPSGCSLHLDIDAYQTHIKRDKDYELPSAYERFFMDPIECFISDSIFENLKNTKSNRLKENEKNNLITLEEIIFKP